MLGQEDNLSDVRGIVSQLAVDRLKELRAPFLTCEAVLSETCFLIDYEAPAVAQLATPYGVDADRFALTLGPDRVLGRLRRPE